MSEPVDYPRVGRFIYTFHQNEVLLEQLRVLVDGAGPAACSLFTTLAARAVWQAGQLEELVVQAHGAASDAVLDAALDEALALQREMKDLLGRLQSPGTAGR